MEKNNARNPGERGQMLILFVLALGVLLGFVAMSVDVGLILNERRNLQNAADAAALAGAQELPDSPSAAVAAAQQWAANNGYGYGGGDGNDDSQGDNDNQGDDGGSGGGAVVTVTVTTPYNGDPNAIEVVLIEKEMPFIFARAVGLTTIPVHARAVATNYTASSGGVALLVLNPDGNSAFEKNGASDVIVNDGAIMVNSTSDTASVRGGSGDVIADGFYYYQEGGWDTSGGSGQFSPEPVPVTDPMIDPLATRTPPDPYVVGTSQHSGGTAADPDTRILSSGSYVLRPGTYWGGIDIRSTANVNFLPGVYVLAGGGFSVTGSGTINGTGAFFYNTFDPEEPSGDGDCKSVNLRGSADFSLRAPTSGEYEDVLFWQDVNCDLPFKHEGSGDFTGGIIYVPGAQFELAGSGNVGTVQIIADTLKVSGTADLIIDYGGFVGEPLPASYKLIE